MLTEPSTLSRSATDILNVASQYSLLELLEARRLIETEAAATAAQRVDKNSPEWKHFADAFSHLLTALDERGEETSSLDLSFHTELVSLSGNRFLVKMLHSIVSDIQDAKKIVMIDFAAADTEKRLHTQAFRAIEQGDADAAHRALV